MNLKFWCLAALLLSSACFVRADDDAAEEDDEYADVDKALLVVRKYIKEELVVQGRNVTVSLEFHNAGAGSALEVNLKDVLPENAKLVDGSLTASYPKIVTGGSVKHSYVLVFTTGNKHIELPAAVITYKPEAEADLQTTHSSIGRIAVLTPVQQIQRYALIAGQYATLGMASSVAHWRNTAIVLVLAGLAYGANNAVKQFNGARVTRTRTRALKELQHS